MNQPAGSQPAGSYWTHLGATTGDDGVQEGESLATIARKFRCDVGDLAKANDINRPNSLKRGQSIRLAGCEG